MTKHHPENERMKRAYQHYLEDAKRMAPATVDHALAAIAEFERCTGYKDFRRFHIEWARAFKSHLNESLNPATGKPLAKSTIRSRLMALKAFFEWLSDKPGYRSRIKYSDAEYFSSSANDERIATAHRMRPIPTMDDIRRALQQMPSTTEIEKRDRALIAFAILSGARDDALASMSVKHVDLATRTVYQDARDVRTKNRKTFTSDFFPVGGEIESIVADWMAYLIRDKKFEPGDPLFPATHVALNGDGQFSAAGLSRTHWKNATAVRRIFKLAFERAGLPYANPHSLRTTLGRLGEDWCNSPAEFKAWSQNLAHEDVLTTFRSYGSVPSHRQREIFAALRARQAEQSAPPGNAPPDAETIQRVLEHVKGVAIGKSSTAK